MDRECAVEEVSEVADLVPIIHYLKTLTMYEFEIVMATENIEVTRSLSECKN